MSPEGLIGLNKYPRLTSTLRQSHISMQTSRATTGPGGWRQFRGHKRNRGSLRSKGPKQWSNQQKRREDVSIDCNDGQVLIKQIRSDASMHSLHLLGLMVLGKTTQGGSTVPTLPQTRTAPVLTLSTNVLEMNSVNSLHEWWFFKCFLGGTSES